MVAPETLTSIIAENSRSRIQQDPSSPCRTRSLQSHNQGRSPQWPAFIKNLRLGSGGLPECIESTFINALQAHPDQIRSSSKSKWRLRVSPVASLTSVNLSLRLQSPFEVSQHFPCFKIYKIASKLAARPYLPSLQPEYSATGNEFNVKTRKWSRKNKLFQSFSNGFPIFA